MREDEKLLIETEEKYKKVLFDKIADVSAKLAELIAKIESVGENIGAERDLNNIAITLNNKLIELQHEFEDKGISLYYEKVEDSRGNFSHIGSNYVGEAIMSELMEYIKEAAQILEAYDKEIQEITKKKVEKVQGLDKATPIRRFFAKIKSFFKPTKQEDMTYTKEEINSINSYLIDYKEKDKQLWNYNLRDNVIQSIVKKIRTHSGYGPYHAPGVPGLLDSCINPDLQKLGLSDLIPELQNVLIEEYKKDLPDPEIYTVSQEDMHLYVPDFSQKKQENGENDIEELSGQPKSLITESKKAIKDGVLISDISLIDKTVKASDRKLVTSVIKGELHPAIENQKDEKQESTNISLEE